MLPSTGGTFQTEIAEMEMASRDYALDMQGNRVNGYVEKLEEVRQAVYFILNTERYEHLIYPFEYGVEFADLIGQPANYVIPTVENRIREALQQDDRIKDVTDFTFERGKRSLHVLFHVNTIYGDMESEVEVNV